MNTLYFSKNNSLLMNEEFEGFNYTPFQTIIKVYEEHKIIAIYSEYSFQFVNREENDNQIVDTFKVNNIFIKRYLIKIGQTYKTYLKLINKSDYTIKVCYLTSLCLSNIFNNINGRDNNDLLVHYYKSSWCGEGKHCIETLNDLYLPIVNDRDSQTYHDFISETTYSTKTYFPGFFFEDRKNHKTTYIYLEPRGRWQLRLAFARKPNVLDHTLTACTFVGNNATCDYYFNLNPNEEYETMVTIFGEGKNLTECVEQINAYKRSKRVAPLSSVVFNDYMNCLWAKPTTGNTIPLVNAVSELGVDIYCMDSGWYKENGEQDWFGALGDWNENNDLFIGFGLTGIIDYVKSKKMKFGLWFELEVCTSNSELAKKDESWFLHQDGERIYENGRYFLDLRNKTVRDYLVNKIHYFYKLGVRYIKNDYNGTFSGCDSAKGSKIYGLEEHQIALSILYKEIQDACKGLIIENCASGSMRSDELVLNNSSLTSFSDAEDYRQYPSIINGCLMNVLPEQLGIWGVSYPFKIFYKNHNFPSTTYIEERKDGEETIFSMVSTFMGQMYLSGRMDKLDKTNEALVKEAIELHKKYTKFISKSNPILDSLDTSLFFKKEGIIDQKLKFENKSLLAVWHLQGGEDTYVVTGKKVKVIYPSDDSFNEIIKTINSNQITIKFNKDYQARLFEIEE